MTPATTRHIVLASRPTGMPAAENFRMEEVPLPEPGPGEVLVRNIYMSVDPYMRGRMRDVKSYATPWAVGKPCDGRAVGRVLRSNDPSLAAGDHVASMLGWRESFVAPGQVVNKIDLSIAPLPAYLGVLGIPGFTGWYGLKEIGRPKPGETLVVSGAAGATGSLVGQMGKILGCRVVGTAGSDEKCAHLTRELGFDAAINYRTAGSLYDALRQACPDGVDVYFENVGGAVLEAVLRCLNPFARIPLCGMISQYNLDPPEPGPRYLFSLVGNRVLMQGFIISDHFDRYPEFLREAGPWLGAGRLKHQETIVEGLDNAPSAFLGLFKGENLGKMLVKIGPEAG